MSEIPTYQEIFLKVLRKLTSPSDLREFLKFKFIWGDEYPYFDFVDLFPRLANMLVKAGQRQLDLDSPVFIAGLRRSGTTVFYRIMNAHSQLFLFNERFPGDRMNGRGVSSTRNIYYSVDDPRIFHDIVVRYLSPSLRGQYSRWGAKLALELAHPDPGSVSVQGMERILAAFPKAKVIGLVRDPRDFVLSALKRGGHDAQWWIDEYLEMMSLFGRLQDTHRESFIVVRYEDLVEEPEQLVRQCCEFAGVSFERNMLDPAYWSKKGPKEYESMGIIRRIGKWSRVRDADLEIVNRTIEACFPQAAQFGYIEEQT